MRRNLIVVCLAVGLVLVGAVALASIPGPDGVIHGCRKNSDGSLRAIDSAASCPNGYTALNWEAGARSGSFYGSHIVQSDTVVPADGTKQVIPVSCPVDEQVISGQFFINDDPGITSGIRPYEPAHNYAGTAEVPVRGYNVYVDAPAIGQPAASLHSELLCAKVVA